MREIRTRLYPRGRYWWVSVTVDGQRSRQTTGCIDKKAARAFVRGLERELADAQQSGQDPTLRLRPPVTLSQACREFAEHMAQHCKHSAFRNYPSRLGGLQEHFGPERALRTISEHEAMDFLRLRRRTTSQKPGAYNNDVGAVRRFFGWCQAPPQRYIERSPVEHAEKVPVARERRRALSEAEVETLVTTVSGTDLEVPVALALLTGLRAGEICTLRWEDVNLEAGELTVGAREDWSPKNRETATLPLCVDLVNRLTQAQARNGRTPYVCSKDGKPWKVYELSKQAARCIRSLGIDCTLHCLRHTFVTALVADPENDPKTIQRLARHKTIATTFDIYAHAQPPRLRQAVARLRLVKPSAPTVIRQTATA